MNAPAISIDTMDVIFNVLLGALLNEDTDAYVFFQTLSVSTTRMLTPDHLRRLVDALLVRINIDSYRIVNLLYNRLDLETYRTYVQTAVCPVQDSSMCCSYGLGYLIASGLVAPEAYPLYNVYDDDDMCLHCCRRVVDVVDGRVEELCA
jgi:hypothetical protein